MGVSYSTETPKPKPLAAEVAPSLLSWAEDNDISAKDVAQAYGAGAGKASFDSGSRDQVNIGFCKDVEIGQYVAIDCEMVGVGGEDDRSVAARASLVNYHGQQIYDSFIRPKEFVTNWRTHVSGVSPKNMATARPFDEVRAEVAEILKGRVLVGHAVKNDLEVMMLTHPVKDIRDTSRFSGFRKYSGGKKPSLKKLAQEILGMEIQHGEHSSIEDARATMLLFRRHKQAFDAEHSSRFPPRPVKTPGEKAKPSKKAKKKR
jgi:RNA exonuclease 4